MGNSAYAAERLLICKMQPGYLTQNSHPQNRRALTQHEIVPKLSFSRVLRLRQITLGNKEAKGSRRKG